MRPLVIAGPMSIPEFAAFMQNLTEDARAVTFRRPDGMVAQEACIHPEAYVDPTALLFGGIVVKAGVYIGPYAVIRLDEKNSPEPLIIGEESNIQDGAIVHSTTRSIGRKVIVAHQAIVHGAEIHDDVTIYIQAVVDGGGTVVRPGCFLHQGCYIGKHITLSPGRYVAPGVKVLTQQQADALPDVPAELLKVREHVLADNAAHVRRYLGR